MNYTAMLQKMLHPGGKHGVLQPGRRRGGCLPPGLTGSMRSGHRNGFCGAPWSRTSTSSRIRFSMCLSRRWGTSWWKCSERSTLGPRTRLSKCPRSFRSVLHCAVWRVVLRGWRSSWWKCRRTRGTRWRWSPRSSFRGKRSVEFSRVFLRVVEGVVLVEVFKVLVLDRIHQRIWSRSPKFLFLRFVEGVVLVEVFKVLSKNRIQQRLWSRSLTFHLAEVFQILSLARVLLPHRVVYGTMQMRILQGFFELFPVRKKVRSWVRTRGRNCFPSRAHPRGELMRTAMLLGDPRRLRGLWVSSSWTQLLTCPLMCMSGWSMFPSCSSSTGWTSLCSCSDVFAALDTVVDMPVMSNDWCFGSTEQITVVSAVAVL